METPSTKSLLNSSKSKSWPLRWLKRISWFAVWLFTVVALVVAFENWRGRKAWAAFTAEMQEKGERLDLESIIPPAIPDEENFAAASIFRPLFGVTVEEVVENGRRFQKERVNDPEGQAALKSVAAFPKGKGTAKGAWEDGKFIDLGELQKVYRSETDYPKAPDPQTPAEDVLLALSKFELEIEAMRVASIRPRTRFPLQYEKHFAMSLPHLEVLRSFAAVVQLRAAAHLDLGAAEEAFKETQFIFRLGESLREEPVVISLLVRYALGGMAIRPLWEGLVRHQWTEEHLAAFEEQLAPINYLAHFQQAFRGERMMMITAVQSLKQASVWQAFSPSNKESSLGSLSPLGMLPDGWLDQSGVMMGRSYQEMIDTVAPRERRIDVERSTRFWEHLEESLGPKWNPRSTLARVAMPAFSSFTQRCAYSQATTNLARVAIALERHRLRHGQYPEVLGALDPAIRPGGEKIPHDPATGRPPHYTLDNAGNYTLYFDGWNGTDDGGQRGWKSHRTTQADITQGDWLWPQPVE